MGACVPPATACSYICSWHTANKSGCVRTTDYAAFSAKQGGSHARGRKSGVLPPLTRGRRPVWGWGWHRDCRRLSRRSHARGCDDVCGVTACQARLSYLPGYQPADQSRYPIPGIAARKVEGGGGGRCCGRARNTIKPFDHCKKLWYTNPK